MTKFLQWLAAFRVFAKFTPVFIDESPEWEDHDAESLRRWLQTPSGSKFQRWLRYREQATNSAAVLRKNDATYACGFAAGVRSCMAWFEVLSAAGAPEVSEQKQLTPKGAKELVETLAP